MSFAKLAKDVALELSGLASAKRIYDEDVKPMVPKRYRGSAMRSVRRYSKKARMANPYRRKFSPMNIGQSPGTDNAQRFTAISTSGVAKNSRTLHLVNLTNIPAATSSMDIDARRRDIMYCSGIKCCMDIRNDTTNVMYVNYAVIAPKGGLGGTVANGGFFRGNASERSQDFSTLLTSLQFRCLPINTDKYTVLKHDRCVVGPDAGAGDYLMNAANNMETISFYVPIKRQLRYDDEGSCEDPVFFVYWFDAAMTASGGTVVNSAALTSEHHITYFREPSRFPRAM